MRCACLALLAFLLIGCAAARTSNGSAAATEANATQEGASKTADERKLRELARKLEVARARLEIARLEAEAFEQQQKASLYAASMEVEMTQAKLARFREADAPNRIASEELDLRSARDRAQEAVDELKQIEIMYEEQDLDDVTAEFVVSRGRRSAERAAQRIAIEEARFKTLQERELPEEEKSLVVAFDKAKAGLERARAEAETGRRSKAVAVLEAENGVEGLEEELAELREKAKP